MATKRHVSSGEWSGFVMERLPDPATKLLWLYMRTCEATTMCGLFPFSLKNAAHLTSIGAPGIMESIALLESVEAVVFDGGYLYIHGYSEDIGAITKRGGWSGWDEHLLGVISDYRGALDNRAFVAFRKRFQEMILRAEQRLIRKPPAEPPDPTAPPHPPTSRAISAPEQPPPTARATAPERAPAQTDDYSEAPTFDVLRHFFEVWRSPGLREACPQPAQNASEFLVWLEGNPRDDWRVSAVKWIQHEIRKENERATAGYATPDAADAIATGSEPTTARFRAFS